MLQMEGDELFKLGIKILISLFGEENRNETFMKTLPFIEMLWQKSEYNQTHQLSKSMDEIMIFYLFRGLLRKSTTHDTLHLLGLFHRAFFSGKISLLKENAPNVSPSHPSGSSNTSSSAGSGSGSGASNNQIIIVMLLANHLLAISDPSESMKSFDYFRLFDANQELSTISDTFRKYSKKKLLSKYLELFYCEFVAIFPEEDVFQLTLSFLLEFIYSEEEDIRLATIRALGNFTQLNYIHDLTREQCKVLLERTIITLHSSLSPTDRNIPSIKTLLFFLLADPRSTFPENVFYSFPFSFPFSLPPFYYLFHFQLPFPPLLTPSLSHFFLTPTAFFSRSLPKFPPMRAAIPSSSLQSICFFPLFNFCQCTLPSSVASLLFILFSKYIYYLTLCDVSGRPLPFPSLSLPFSFPCFSLKECPHHKLLTRREVLRAREEGGGE